MLIKVIEISIVAGILIGIGGLLLHLIRGRTNGFSRLIQVNARLLMVVGFFIVCEMFVSFLSGRMGGSGYIQKPAFYLSAGLVIASLLWWIRNQMLGSRPDHNILGCVAYPGLVLALVISFECFVRSTLESHHRVFDSALQRVEGQIAPEIEFIDPEGKKCRLSEFKGRVVLLNFWATWCSPCIQEMPALSALQRKFRDSGLVLIYLSPEEPEVITKFFAARQLDGLNCRPNREVPEFYQWGKAWPMSFVVDRAGIIKAAYCGNNNEDLIEKEIQKAL